MGNTEWAFLVKNPEDLLRWQESIRAHNTCENWEDVGEDLEVVSVLRYPGGLCEDIMVPPGLYLLATSMGGRDRTRKFVREKMATGDVVLDFYNKPDNWLDCQDFAWEGSTASTDEIPHAIFDPP